MFVIVAVIVAVSVFARVIVAALGNGNEIVDVDDHATPPPTGR